MSDRRQAGRLFLALLLLYGALSGGHLYSIDDHTNYCVAEGLWLRGSPEIVLAPAERHLTTVSGREGRSYSYYGIGGPLFFLPAVAVGHATAPWTGAAVYASHALIAATGAAVAAATAAVLFLFLRRREASSREALTVTLLYAIATLALVWSKYMMNSSQVALLLLVACWLLEGSGRWRWALAGTALGMAVNVRYDAVLGALLVAGVYLVRERRRGARLAELLAGGLLPLLLFGWYNQARFAGFWRLGYPDLQNADAFATPLLTGLYGLLLSPNRGLFFYSPLLLLLPWSWVALGRKRDWSGLALFLVLPLVYALFFARFLSWHAGVCWGPRYLAVGLPFLCAGLVPLMSWRGGARRALWTLAGISLAIQLWCASISIDSYHDWLVEHGINALASSTDPALAPLWGAWQVAARFEWDRVLAAPPAAMIPAGGYPMTVKLRFTPDYWPFYAYRLGLPAVPLALAWFACMAVALWLLRSVALSAGSGISSSPDAARKGCA